MKFGELPVEVQVVAARVLAEKMQSATAKKPAELASEVRDAFTGLYSDPVSITIRFEVSKVDSDMKASVFSAD